MKSTRMRWYGNCTVCARDEKCIHSFNPRPKGKRQLGRLGLEGRILLKLILTSVGYENVDCIHLAQDRSQYQAVVHIVTDIQILQKMGNFLCN
jgi:hypothetical protein